MRSEGEVGGGEVAVEEGRRPGGGGGAGAPVHRAPGATGTTPAE